MEPLLVKIFDVDFYMSTPISNFDITFSQFRGSAIHQVPVIRIFGSTTHGKKICVHIHGVFPYFYIPYDETEAASGLMYKIATNLDKAINVSLGQASSTNQHIYKITLVSGIPFYGYHSKKHQFFKVYLYNPLLIKRVNNLLFNDSVLGKLYQPHETHLNFTLQFMIDFNLHGMSNLILSKVRHRYEMTTDEVKDCEGDLQKVSTCELECDALSEHILNRQEIESGNLAANPGIAALWEDEKQRRRNKNEDSQIPHYLSLSKTNVPPTESHELFRRALKERLCLISDDKEKDIFSTSVYPAECTRNKSILNCSYVDFHSSQSFDSSFSTDSELNQTISNDTLNLTLDQDVQELIDVLADLEKNVGFEEDSILSQVSKNEGEEIEEDIDLDKSLEESDNLLDETIKISQLCGSNEDEMSNLYPEKNQIKNISIPQLDGHCYDFQACSSLSSFDEFGGHSEFHKTSIVNLETGRKDHNKSKPNNDNLRKKTFLADTHTNKSKSDSDYLKKLKILPSCVSYTAENSYTNVTKTERWINDIRVKEKGTIIKIPCASYEIKNSACKQIIESLLEKEVPYFSANSIGSRVALKNYHARRKCILRTQLTYCRDVVVLLENLHLPKRSKIKKNMPSLTNDLFSSSSESEKNNKIFKKVSIILKRVIYNKPEKTIQRRRFVNNHNFRRTHCKKRYLIAQKVCQRNERCFRMLESGCKPVFKIIPGYRPYLFQANKILKTEQDSESSRKVGVEQENSLTREISNKEENKEISFKSLEELLQAQKQNEAKFFSSIDCLMEDFNINETKLLKHDEDMTIESKIDDVNTSKMLFVDGANDSPSDDDSCHDKKARKRRSKNLKASYSSLPISSNCPVAPGVTLPVTEQTSYRITATNKPKISETRSCDNIEKIKRKLRFAHDCREEISSEDKLICDLKPVKSSQNFRNLDISSNEKKEFNLKVSMEFFNGKPNQNSESSHGQQSINNANAFEDQPSSSVLYDIVNDFIPKQGCSKLDPDSTLIRSQTPSSGSFSTEKSNSGIKTPDSQGTGHSENSKDLIFPLENVESIKCGNVSKVDEDFSSSGSRSTLTRDQNEKNGKFETTSSSDRYYFRPQYKAPTRYDVELSLSNLNIPKIRALKPFYSSANDATGCLEVGYNILKIKTLTSLDTPDFESSFGDLTAFRKNSFPEISLQPRPNASEYSRYFYSGQYNCSMKPVKQPPSRKEVMKWIKEQSTRTVEVKDKRIKKNKIYMGSSQDDCSNQSLDLSLTLTPLSDLDASPVLHNSDSESRICSEMSDSEGSTYNDVSHTPSSTKSSIIESRRRRKKIDRSILRKSTLLSQFSDNSGIISGVTLNNTYGFKNSLQNYQNAKASVQHEYLTIFAMEVHVNTRGDFKPNPRYDSIEAIFYSVSNDVEESSSIPRRTEGLFAVSPVVQDKKESTRLIVNGTGISCDVKCVENELELIKEFSKFVLFWDPDIIIGYEIQMLSWGFLIERCHHLGINIIPEISRVKDKHLKFNEKETGDLRVTGRIVLDFWRLLRHEIALQSYTLQSTVYEILQKRIPKYSFRDLTDWWNHHTQLFRHRTVSYYLTVVRSTLKLLEQLDIVGRTSELARLFGIQWYEVLSRGSQFRVESMMLRLAKPLNYVAVSPSVQQRAKMKAPEFIALVLEPESKLYTEPVIVLDFQSLYPSIIIAYNYCFSTCVGRVELLGKSLPFEFGTTNLKVSRDRLRYLVKNNLLNFSPCGVGFVKKRVRDGIMPRMLREILDTRLMVKKSMKENKEDSLLQKVLHNRQLGLKLIANVTYGYTAANFSGRMPSVELGDSIVSKARETLQRTIALVDGNKEWGARVVYGDTDSLFVHCPGKSREEAFSIGEKIVEAVGKENPDPVKLKLEKVYQPCILQTKKRYVGYMYETVDQKEPVYDAKGIETVRRDGCPAVSKMLEKSLRILFETKDVSRVKKYCVKQFNKIIMGRINIRDLTFAKEYRGITGYKPGACVPSLELARKWIAYDQRAEPRRGERVPYVIINGPPGLPLIRLVRSPYELLSDPTLRPNALYYITRVIIPPLNRCFNLIGADLSHWFHQMPRKQLQYLPIVDSPTKKSTISQYFVSTLCAVCGTQTQDGLCVECVKKPQQTVTILSEKTRQWEASYNNCKLICSSCTQILDDIKCISLDCPVLYRLHQTGRDLQQANHIRQLLHTHFDLF